MNPIRKVITTREHKIECDIFKLSIINKIRYTLFLRLRERYLKRLDKLNDKGIIKFTIK